MVCYYKVRQVLQSETILLQSAAGITKCDDYHKVRQNVSSVYGISTVVSQTSFGRKTSGSVAKCQLFFQANTVGVHNHLSLYCYYYYCYYCCCYYYYLVW